MELNKIYNEDCLDTMKRMKDNFIDLVVTSPPYDNMREYNGYSFDFENIAKELYRVIKKGGVIAWIVGDETINGSESGTSFKQALYFKELGFNLHDTMIYETNKPPITGHKRYQPSFEYMFILSKGTPKTFNPILRRRKWEDKRNEKVFNRNKNGDFKINKWNKTNDCLINNVWYYETGFGNSSNDKISFKHPATFPEQLAADHIYTWSNENDVIYDPFGGSGTTAKMAHLLKRDFILSEISPGYIDVIDKRLYQYLNQKTIF